jgi:PAS domain S-box-containing protein
METFRDSVSKQVSRRLIVFPYVIALLLLGVIVWATITLLRYPNDGIYVLQSDGYIGALQRGGPADGKLKPGDKIFAIEDVIWNGLMVYYPNLGKQSGSPVTFTVERNNSLIPVTISLAQPSLDLIVNRLVTVVVALCFWIVGLVVGAFKPIGKSGGISFFWFQASALTLTTGAISITGLTWASMLFNCMLWVLGPMSVHFHMFFPQSIHFETRRIMLFILYGIGVVGTLPYLLISPARLASLDWFTYFLSANRIFLAINLLLVVGILVYGYRHATTPGVRGKIRLVMLGTGLVVIPFVSLTVLPEALLHQALVPYSLAFLLLILLPLTYGYAIFRLNFIEIDKQVNRGATYILVYSILGGFYLCLYALMTTLVWPDTANQPLVNTILVLILASIFFPLHGRVQRFVDQVFYGGWYDYRVGVTQITRGLEQITDLHELGKVITNRLVNTLRLEEAVAFFRDLAGDFSVIEVSLTRQREDQTPITFPVLPRSSLTYLLKIGTVERSTLIKSLSEITLTPEELQLLNTEQIHLWVPVIGHGQILGLLALGPKLGGDIFSSEDLDILRVVVQQVGTTVENIHLLTRLKEYAGELEKRVEERTAELFDAKERVEAILASVGDGVIVTDLRGQVLTVNTAFEGLCGLAAEEVVGRSLFSLFSEEDNDPQQIAAMRNALSSGRTWSGELIGRRLDNSRYEIQFTIAPVRDRSGQAVSYVGSMSDITRKKELDRMKDMFISDVSHELRTPITNIRLYLELLESAPPERQKRFLAVIKEQSELLTKLVEDILDLSRLTILKARKVAFTNVNLNNLIEQVVTAHLPLAEASGVRLIFEAAQDLPHIRAEHNQIARLVTNLISNAIRYSPRGQVCVRTESANGTVCLTVQDTGIGIEQQDLPHIYERFYRGRNVRQSEIHGTGLGLAIVKEIVDLHDGEIQVQSAVGKGSTFQVKLPAVMDDLPHED